MSDIENEGCGALAPVFDMLNHSNEPNCDWESDDGAQITIESKVKKGEELFISYGQRQRLYSFILAWVVCPVNMTV